MPDNKGLVIEAPDRIHYKTFPMPQVKEDELLIRVKYIALCGSDIKLFEGKYTAPHRYPIILGHEWVGEIVGIGNAAGSKFHVGDIVTGDCSIYCNHCMACEKDKNLCESIEKRGITVDGACINYISTKPQYVYLCGDVKQVLPFVLSEPMAVVTRAFRNRIIADEVKPSNRALIFGCGGIGILGMIYLQNMGVKDIIMVDTNIQRVRLAESLGGEGVKGILFEDLMKGWGLENVFDVAFEASGSRDAIKSALKLAGRNAKIFMVGHQQSVELDMSEVIKKSLEIYGSIGGTGGFPESIQLISTRRDTVSDLITEIVPAVEAVQYFSAGKYRSSIGKVVISL
ncbi:MAG TPA: alcohol dehydrogenase catalytic domain-containing protein [Ruminiclostridium sp.]|nr:alcohol dehydrogenase catalytic domain-containing protein [Ruminiclostridium sp.]